MAYVTPTTRSAGNLGDVADYNILCNNDIELESRKDTSYVQFTANVVTATTVEASSTTIVTAGAVTANGTDTYEIEFFCTGLSWPGNAATNAIVISVFDGGTQVGRIATFQRTDVATDTRVQPVCAAYRLVPTAASHTYSIRAFHTAAAGTFQAGAGGVGISLPGYIRVRKVQ